MSQQNYDNHRRWVPMYHFVLSSLIVLVFIGSLVNLFAAIGAGSGLYSASLISALTLAVALNFVYLRGFPLKAQDRVIRLEENLRHQELSGEKLSPELNARQIIGLRFASDEEMVELAKRAVAENMTEDQIKKAVKNWRSDTFRV